jgi:hypothetical protein
MPGILKKLKEYRGDGPDIEIENMLHLKEIYDSYLMNKQHGKAVPDWDETEIYLLKLNYETFFYLFHGFHEARYIEASPFF